MSEATTMTTTAGTPAGVINYVEGDVLDLSGVPAGKTVLIPHVCNAVGAWGAGFVVPLGRAYPAAKQAYLDWFERRKRDTPAPTPVPPATGIDVYGPTQNRGFALGLTQAVRLPREPGGTWHDPAVVICNMIAQADVNTVGAGGHRRLRYISLASCIHGVVYALADARKLLCGADGGRGIRGDEVVVRAPMFGSGLAGGRWEFIADMIQEAWVDRGYEVTVCRLPDAAKVAGSPRRPTGR